MYVPDGYIYIQFREMIYKLWTVLSDTSTMQQNEIKFAWITRTVGVNRYLGLVMLFG